MDAATRERDGCKLSRTACAPAHAHPASAHATRSPSSPLAPAAASAAQPRRAVHFQRARLLADREPPRACAAAVPRAQHGALAAAAAAHPGGCAAQAARQAGHALRLLQLRL
eukprot:3306521-Prymnesium_polylepis.1